MIKEEQGKSQPGSRDHKAEENLNNFHDNFVLIFANHVTCSIMALIWSPY